VYRDLYGRTWPQSELLGLTLLESMAVGTPVVATRVGGMPEYVSEGVTGFTVPPNDPDALRQQLLHLLDDEALRGRMGKAGWQRVQAWSWPAVGDAYVEQYRSLDPAGA
jgi:glycosyltransferase involved in cell wall biosynthesis